MRRFPSMLVADDDEYDLRMIARALPTDDPSSPVHFARDGGEALDFLYGRGRFSSSAPERPGVLLLDLHMPRCNGWDVLREVRADPQFRFLPIVVFSSSDREHDMRSCYDLGATAYVMKPHDAAVFRQTVARIHAFWIGCNRLAGSSPPPAPPLPAQPPPGSASKAPGRSPRPAPRGTARHKMHAP